MEKPKKETYGYESATSFESEAGWTIEGGEEAYYKALEKYEAAQIKPDS